MKRKYLASIFTLILITLITACGKDENEKAAEPKEQTVYIYYVALEGTQLTGKPIGCNDVLVREEKNVIIERSPLEAALNELVTSTPKGELKNFIKGPQLMLVQVTIANGIADVYLKGDFNISGVCDIPRIQEQLTETAKQFSDLEKVNFYINDQTLDNYLSVAKVSF
ncbi:MAG: GerMN domain-containing protein [Bacteroidota bacterium]